MAASLAEAETEAVEVPLLLLVLLEAFVAPDELLLELEELDEPAPDELLLEELAPDAADVVAAPAVAALPAELEESPPDPQAAKPQQIEASTA